MFVRVVPPVIVGSAAWPTAFLNRRLLEMCDGQSDSFITTCEHSKDIVMGIGDDFLESQFLPTN